jgi:DNA phosphorothioation-dependent restriction protein DptG
LRQTFIDFQWVWLFFDEDQLVLSIFEMHQTRFNVEKKGLSGVKWRDDNVTIQQCLNRIATQVGSSREDNCKCFETFKKTTQNLKIKLKNLKNDRISKWKNCSTYSPKLSTRFSEREKFTQIYSSLYNQLQTSSTHCETVVNKCLKNGYLLQRIIRFNWQQIKELLQIIQPRILQILRLVELLLFKQLKERKK